MMEKQLLFKLVKVKGAQTLYKHYNLLHLKVYHEETYIMKLIYS